MSKTAPETQTAETPDIDPAMLAELRILMRNRQLQARALLKRRRRKSGQ